MFRVSSRRTCPWRAAGVLWAVLTFGMGGVWAQPAPDEQGAQTEDELGLRFTPEMAQGIGKRVAENVFQRRYELDAAKMDEATERIARRLMAFAHEHQDRGQDLVEFWGSEMAKLLSESAETRRNPGIPRSFGMGFAERVLPVMPDVRKLVTGIREDIQPMLPPKQQMRLMGDIMAAGAAMDAFESHMKRWVKGDVDPYADPFNSADREVETDEHGESEALRNAKQHAQNMVDTLWQSTWERYVEDAKKLYALDDAQAATADSILAEAIARGEQIAADPTWRRRTFRSQVWSGLWRHTGLGHADPVDTHLADVFSEQFAPFREVGAELRARIDKIPTETQREAAEQRMKAVLVEKGVAFQFDEAR
ncbi:MAG: hypothetical protein JXA69_09065 [Phycisphaerae bacterium]|nr:hypothetical protein [Phycisphaerae bacterium]